MAQNPQAFIGTSWDPTKWPKYTVPDESVQGYTPGSQFDRYNYQPNQWEQSMGRAAGGLDNSQAQNLYNAMVYAGGLANPTLPTTAWNQGSTDYLKQIAGSALGQYNMPNAGTTANPLMATLGYNNSSQWGGNQQNQGQWQGLYNNWMVGMLSKLLSGGYTRATGGAYNPALYNGQISIGA